MTQQKAVGNILEPSKGSRLVFPHLIPVDGVDLPVAMVPHRVQDCNYPTCLIGERVSGPFVPGR